MKEIIAYIKNRAQGQINNPLLVWLRDERIPAKARLANWVYPLSQFAFGFADLNNMILRYPEEEAATDPLKRAINQHANEDGNHWGWYLSDVKKLGLDNYVCVTELMRYLWGPRTKAQRYGTYRLCQLADRAQDPVLRYCLIETIEVFGEFLFSHCQAASEALTRETGIELSYLGPTHFAREPGHLTNQKDDTESKLIEMELSPEKLAAGMEIAKEVCQLLEDHWVELYHQALEHKVLGAEPIAEAEQRREDAGRLLVS